MNKTYPLILLCLCYFFCFAQKKPNSHRFDLEGTIKGNENSAVYLCYIDSRKKFHVDSTHLENGRFRLMGLINGPTVAFITTIKKSLPEEDDDIMKTDGKNSTLFFLEPKSMKAKLEHADFRNSSFTGSFSQTEYAEYTNQLSRINDRYKAQNDSLQVLVSINKAQKEAGRAQLVSLRNAVESEVEHRFFSLHPHSYVTAYLVSIAHIKLDSLNLFYRRLPLPVKLSTYGKEIQEKIEKKERVAVGKIAPVFKQAASAGDSIALKDFRGNYVLLQYWNSTSASSRADNRAMIPVYNRFKNKNFTILGISLDGQKTKALWQAAIEKDQLPWPQLAALKSNHNQAVLKYDVQSVPANFLIGPSGKIVATDLKADQLNQLLTKFFK
jgi:peroxiredoxin